MDEASNDVAVEMEMAEANDNQEPDGVQPLGREVLRLSKPMPALADVVDGRTDFFAELAQVVALEIQRLMRYTMLTYAQPRDTEQEQKLEADVQNALADIMTHLAEYVDTAVQIVSSARGDEAAESSVEVMVLQRQLDESIAHGQDLMKKLGHQEERLGRLNKMVRTMRVQYYKDIEGQRDRFRGILGRYLPELEAAEMQTLLGNLTDIKLFNNSDFMDEDTQMAIQSREAALEKEFEVERETLLSQIQILTEMEAQTQHKLKVALKRGKNLQANLEDLTGKKEVPVEVVVEDDHTSQIEQHERLQKLLAAAPKAPAKESAAKVTSRAEMRSAMEKSMAAEKVRQNMLAEAMVTNDMLKKQQVWLEDLATQDCKIKDQVAVFKLNLQEVMARTSHIQEELQADEPKIPEEKAEFDMNQVKEAMENDMKILTSEKEMLSADLTSIKEELTAASGSNVQLEAANKALKEELAAVKENLQSEHLTVEALQKVDAPKTEVLKHAKATLRILKTMKWDKQARSSQDSSPPSIDETSEIRHSLIATNIDESIADLVQDEVKTQQAQYKMEVEAIQFKLEQSYSRHAEQEKEKQELQDKVKKLNDELQLSQEKLQEEQAAHAETLLVHGHDPEDHTGDHHEHHGKHKKKHGKAKKAPRRQSAEAHDAIDKLIEDDESGKEHNDDHIDEAGEEHKDEAGSEHKRSGKKKKQGNRKPDASTTEQSAQSTEEKNARITEELGKDTHEVGCQTRVRKRDQEISCHPEHAEEQCQVGIPKGRKKTGPHDCSAVLEWHLVGRGSSKGGLEQAMQEAHESEIRELKGKIHRMQLELDTVKGAEDGVVDGFTAAKSLPASVVQSGRVPGVPTTDAANSPMPRILTARQKYGDHGVCCPNCGTSVPSRGPSKSPRRRNFDDEEVGDLFGTDGDLLDAMDHSSNYMSSKSKKASDALKKMKAEEEDEGGSSLSVVLDEVVEKAELKKAVTMGRQKTQTETEEEAAKDLALSEQKIEEAMTLEQRAEYRLLKEKVQQFTPEQKLACVCVQGESVAMWKSAIFGANASTSVHQKLKNELRVEYEEVLTKKIEKERARIYRAWPRIASAETIVRRKESGPGEPRRTSVRAPLRRSASLAITANTIRNEVISARDEALRRIDHARMLTYSHEALTHNASSDARVDDLRELLESKELFAHYECIGTLTRRLMACQGEFRRMRKRMAGALFECDRLRVELYLQRESYVASSCDFHVLWRRQAFWLSKCVEQLNSMGSHVPVPEPLLQQHFDSDTVSEVLRQELATQGKGVGGIGETEVEVKLERRRGRVRHRVLVNIHRNILDSQLKAYKMADALFVFHKIQEDEPGAKPKREMPDIPDVRQVMADSSRLVGAASSLKMRLRVFGGSEQEFEEQTHFILRLMDKIQTREQGVLDQYKESINIEEGHEPPRREFKQTMHMATQANRYLDDGEYLCSEGQIEAALEPIPESSDDDTPAIKDENENDIGHRMADAVQASLRRMDKQFEEEDAEHQDSVHDSVGKGSVFMSHRTKGYLQSAVRNNFSMKSSAAKRLTAVVEMAKAKRALMDSHSVVQEVEDAMKIPQKRGLAVDETPRQRKAIESAKKLEVMDPAKAAELVMKMSTEERGLVMEAMESTSRRLLLEALPAVVAKMPTQKQKEVQRNYEQMMGKPIPETDEEAEEHAAQLIAQLIYDAENEKACSRQVSGNADDGNADSPPERVVSRVLPATPHHGVWDIGDPIGAEVGPSFGFFDGVMALAPELQTLPSPFFPRGTPHPKVSVEETPLEGTQLSIKSTFPLGTGTSESFPCDDDDHKGDLAAEDRDHTAKVLATDASTSDAAPKDGMHVVEILAPDASTEAMQEREAELCARCRMPYYENANFCAGCGYKRFGTAPSQARKDKASPEPEYESEEDEQEEEAAKNQHKKGRPKPNIASQPEKSRAKANSTIQQEDDEDEADQEDESQTNLNLKQIAKANHQTAPRTQYDDDSEDEWEQKPMAEPSIKPKQNHPSHPEYEDEEEEEQSSPQADYDDEQASVRKQEVEESNGKEMQYSDEKPRETLQPHGRTSSQKQKVKDAKVESDQKDENTAVHHSDRSSPQPKAKHKPKRNTASARKEEDEAHDEEKEQYTDENPKETSKQKGGAAHRKQKATVRKVEDQANANDLAHTGQGPRRLDGDNTTEAPAEDSVDALRAEVARLRARLADADEKSKERNKQKGRAANRKQKVEDAGVESDHENENAMVHHSARSNPQPKAKRKPKASVRKEQEDEASHEEAVEDEEEKPRERPRQKGKAANRKSKASDRKEQEDEASDEEEEKDDEKPKERPREKGTAANRKSKASVRKEQEDEASDEEEEEVSDESLKERPKPKGRAANRKSKASARKEQEDEASDEEEEKEEEEADEKPRERPRQKGRAAKRESKALARKEEEDEVSEEEEEEDLDEKPKERPRQMGRAANRKSIRKEEEEDEASDEEEEEEDEKPRTPPKQKGRAVNRKSKASARRGENETNDAEEWQDSDDKPRERPKQKGRVANRKSKATQYNEEDVRQHEGGGDCKISPEAHSDAKLTPPAKDRAEGQIKRPQARQGTRITSPRLKQDEHLTVNFGEEQEHVRNNTKQTPFCAHMMARAVTPRGATPRGVTPRGSIHDGKKDYGRAVSKYLGDLVGEVDDTHPETQAVTETRETQTDMPLNSNMKVASTQTEVQAVERVESTRRSMRRSVASRRTQNSQDEEMAPIANQYNSEGEIAGEIERLSIASLEQMKSNAGDSRSLAKNVSVLTKLIKLQNRQRAKRNHKHIEEFASQCFKDSAIEQADRLPLVDPVRDESPSPKAQPRIITTGSVHSLASTRRPIHIHPDLRAGATPKDSGQDSSEVPDGSLSAEEGKHLPKDLQEDANQDVPPEIREVFTTQEAISTDKPKRILEEATPSPDHNIGTPSPDLREATTMPIETVENKQQQLPSTEAPKQEMVSKDDVNRPLSEIESTSPSVVEHWEELSEVALSEVGDVEVVDCMQQCDVSWDAIPGGIVSWLKVNLMQKMQGEFYCLPWSVSDLEWFPELSSQKRERLIKDFEDFLTSVMGRVQPSKHEVRRRLRKKYRTWMQDQYGSNGSQTDELSEREGGRAEREFGSLAMMQRGTLTDESAVPERFRGSLMHRGSLPQQDYLMHERESDLQNCGSDESEDDAHQQEFIAKHKARKTALKRAGTTASVQFQAPAYTKAVEEMLHRKTLVSNRQDTTKLKPERSVDDTPSSRQFEVARSFFMEEDDGQPKLSDLEAALGFKLPESVFDGSTDQDPYCLSAAAREGFTIPGKASDKRKQQGDTNATENHKTKLTRATTEALSGDELENAVKGQVTFCADPDQLPPQDSCPNPDTGTRSSAAVEQQVQKIIKVFEGKSSRIKMDAFTRLLLATRLPTIKSGAAFEYTKGMSGMTLPHQLERSQWRTQRSQNRGVLQHARPEQLQPPQPPEGGYVGAVCWRYDRVEMQPAAEPEPEAPVTLAPVPPKEPWTQKRAEELIRALADPRDHIASLTQRKRPHGFTPRERRDEYLGIVATLDVPDPLKSASVPSGDGPHGGSAKEVPADRLRLMTEAGWTTIQSSQLQTGEIALPQILPPGSPPKDHHLQVKRTGTLKTPREGPKFGGTG